MRIDWVAAIELDPDELEELGLSNAIGGLFGENHV